MTSSAGDLDETLQVSGHRIRVRVRGSGDPLLLVNGIGAPLSLWRPLEDRLDGVRAISFDAPGSGDSGTPDLPLSVAGHARLALRLLDELDCPRASVLGFSFGGLVAQEMARRAGAAAGPAGAGLDVLRLGGLLGHPAALLAVVPGVGAARPPTRALPGRVDPLGQLYQVWAAATWSSVPWLAGVRQPTLVLTGDRDRVVPPANARILTALLPNARLHVVRGGGHLCLLDRAEEVSRVLRDFLDAGLTAPRP